MRRVFTTKLDFVIFFLVSGVPRNVDLLPFSHNELRLSWNPPFEKNGVISGYFITWRIVRNATNHMIKGALENTTTDLNEKFFEISNLGKCYFYLNCDPYVKVKV